MTKKTFLKTQIASLALLISFTTPTLAASFNPNYIISDADLTDWQSMGRAEINSFLRNKNSYLTDLIIEDAEDKRRRAGEIIYQAARNYQINPKYLLVKLQKEQSLVSDPDPTQRQLDWATGYGACDSCDTTDAKLQKYKGFGKQVDAAAGVMRWYYDHVSEPIVKKANTAYQIDGTTVVPASMATAFLYTYTPHLHGNENFWKLWQKWFNQVYPEGTLLRSDTEPTVYLLQGGQKRPIGSMNVLVSRFNPKLIITAPASELDRYATGSPIRHPNYSILKSDESYYLIDDDTLRPFADATIVRKFGYNPDEIITVENDELKNYAIGRPITLASQNVTGQLVRLDVNQALYYIKDGTYYSIPDNQIATVRFPNSKIRKVTVKDLENLTDGGLMLLADGTLIGVKGSAHIYVIEKTKRRLISSDTLFKQLGYQAKNILYVSDLTASLHPIGEPMYSRDQTTPTDAAPTTTTPTPETTLTYFTPPTTLGPVRFPETGKMMALPPEQVSYLGAAKFVTPIDTYLVAAYNEGDPAVLAAKNADIPRPLASFTKVMTGYRLFAEGANLDKISLYNPARHRAEAGNLFPVVAGDQIRNGDLLYALLVSSLNTPARMLVDSLDTDETAFIGRMNEQAKSWGLTKTYFSDTSGYNLGNQSTAREYLTLFTKALENATLTNYLGAKDYQYDEVTSADKKITHGDTHSNKLVLKSNLPYRIVASKTGYLNESGYGITMLVERKTDGKQFVLITMGNPDYTKKFSETERFAEWAMKNF